MSSRKTVNSLLEHNPDLINDRVKAADRRLPTILTDLSVVSATRIYIYVAMAACSGVTVVGPMPVEFARANVDYSLQCRIPINFVVHRAVLTTP